MSDSLQNSIAPVLVTAFNRPEKLRQLLLIISQAKVERLYIVIDGPRPGHESDVVLTAQTAEVAGSTKWAEEVLVKTRDINLGCGLSPADAIAGVLKQEDSVIVLEDDCHPSLDFFNFVQQGLTKYRGDMKVGAICGTSYVPSTFFRSGDKVWASRLFSPWGWGTWARAWHGFTSESVDWGSRTNLRQRVATGAYSVAGLRWLESNWRWLAQNDPTGVQVWDHLFGLLLCGKNQVVIKPTVNLVRNVGYGPDATHAKQSGPLERIDAQKWEASLADWPRKLKVNVRADRWILKHDYQAQSTASWLGDLFKAGTRRLTGRSG